MDYFSFIKNALPVLDVISDYVSLKVAGHYWKGSCPFHTETDASFTVSPDKQIFYCFGCHATGDVIAFMAKVENVGQMEAAKMLTERYKLTVPSDLLVKGAQGSSAAQQEQKDRFDTVLKAVARWCHENLYKNAAAHRYLADRCIGDQTINDFQIGLFPGGTQGIGLLIKDMAAQGILIKDLVACAVLGEKGSYFYSPYEERIVFPIKDHFGRYCGFGGRIFRAGDERAKYYNSKEADWFIKGKILFGLDAAKKSMQATQTAFLVEGYMDCVAMAQAGHTNTVATLGTACTLEHLKMLARYITVLHVLYDGDQAGQKAILRITQICWEANVELRVVKLPPKEDPASMLAKKLDLGPYVAAAEDIVAFFVKTVAVDFFKKTLAEKLVSIHKIFDIVLKTSDPLKRDLLLQQASVHTDLPLMTLKDGLAFYERTQQRSALGSWSTQAEGEVVVPVPVLGQPEGENFDELEEKILFVILKMLEKSSSFVLEERLLPYFSPLIKKILLRAVSSMAHGAGFSLDHFLSSSTPQEQRVITRILMAHDSEVTEELFEQLKRLFCKQHWKKIVKDFKLQISQAQQQADTHRVQELLALFSTFKQGFAQEGLV